MKICIISDLHCKYQLDFQSPSETFFFSNMPRLPITQNPVSSILKLIQETKGGLLNSDIVLCLGDLGDKADEQGIISAWNAIDEIRQKMGAEERIGIPGNHDINSRGKNNRDPFDFISNFHEEFPTNDSNLNVKFWSDKFCIKVYKNVLFLLINTSHNHTDTERANSSIIEKSTLEKIEGELRRFNSLPINHKICILHHHPIKHSNINNWNDSDSLDNGDELISILNKKGFTIVIHGHKHQPRITEINGLNIFATGSFSSFANLQGTGFQTMFHVIDLEEKTKKGIIHSWEFDVRQGWRKNFNHNFPSEIGFGGTADLTSIVEEINESFLAKNGPIIYSEILKKIPVLQFLIPEKLQIINQMLNEKYDLHLAPPFPLTPSILTTNKQ